MVVIFYGASRPESDWSVPSVVALGALTGAIAGAALGWLTGLWLPSLDGQPVHNGVVLALVGARRSGWIEEWSGSPYEAVARVSCIASRRSTPSTRAGWSSYPRNRSARRGGATCGSPAPLRGSCRRGVVRRHRYPAAAAARRRRPSRGHGGVSGALAADAFLREPADRSCRGGSAPVADAAGAQREVTQYDGQLGAVVRAGPPEVRPPVLDRQDATAVARRVVAALPVATAPLGHGEVVADRAPVEVREVLLPGREPGAMGPTHQEPREGDGLATGEHAPAARVGVEVVELDGVEPAYGASACPGRHDAREPLPLPGRTDVQQPLAPGRVENGPATPVQHQAHPLPPEAGLAGLGLEPVDITDVVVTWERRGCAIPHHDADPRRYAADAPELVLSATLEDDGQWLDRRHAWSGAGEEQHGDRHERQPAAHGTPLDKNGDESPAVDP